MFRTLLLIGFGGAIGSIARYMTSQVINKWFTGLFPYATFAANSLGCLLIGIFIGLFHKNLETPSGWYFLLVTGFCGGYTTFSTFTAENFNLLQQGNYLTAFSYIFLSVSVGLVAIFSGFLLSKLI